MLKPRSTQEPTSFRARHTKLTLQQCRNITLSIKIQAAKSHTHLKTHYWTLHCTPERRDPAPSTRTLTQASLTRKPWQATHPTPPTWSNLHNKEEPQTSSTQRGHPKHSNLNKMKRQKNIQQVKEHDKCPPNQTKEEEIGSLPEKEFRIMIVKMIQNLENKMELQINRLETKDWEDARNV